MLRKISSTSFFKKNTDSFFTGSAPLDLVKAIALMDVLQPGFEGRSEYIKILFQFHESSNNLSPKVKRNSLKKTIQKLETIYKQLPYSDSNMIQHINNIINTSHLPDKKKPSITVFNKNLASALEKIIRIKNIDFDQLKDCQQANITKMRKDILINNMRNLLNELEKEQSKNDSLLIKMWQTIFKQVKDALKKQYVGGINLEKTRQAISRLDYPMTIEEFNKIFDNPITFDDSAWEEDPYAVGSDPSRNQKFISNEWSLATAYSDDELKIIRESLEQHFKNNLNIAANKELIARIQASRNDINELKRQIDNKDNRNTIELMQDFSAISNKYEVVEEGNVNRLKL